MTVNFTHQVAQQLSCPTEDNQRMVECLRTKTAKEIVDVNINMYVSVSLSCSFNDMLGFTKLISTLLPSGGDKLFHIFR